MTILFAYDGSASADEAIKTAAKLLRSEGADAVVVSVWEPLMVEAVRASRFGGPFVGLPAVDPTDVDKRSEVAAQRLADAGVQLATTAGIDARALCVADSHDIAATIIQTAADLDADLIVLGARGLTGVRAFLGSVSNHVLQNANRPVLVVPGASPA